MPHNWGNSCINITTFIIQGFHLKSIINLKATARAANIALKVDVFSDKQWQRLAIEDLSLQALAKAVSETKSQIAANKPSFFPDPR